MRKTERGEENKGAGTREGKLEERDTYRIKKHRRRRRRWINGESMGACLRRESKIRRMAEERVCVTHTHNEMRERKVRNKATGRDGNGNAN